MKGDFSRNTFDPTKRFSSVRMQQGRVQLDADWNEQVDIVTHQLRTEAIDFIGATGAPIRNAGFAITASKNNGKLDLSIKAGRYYINGFLCEKFNNEFYTMQEDYPNAILPTQDGVYLAYLETWQHSVNIVTDPAIREIALDGADTTVREKLIAQVKLYPLANNSDSVDQQVDAAWAKITADTSETTDTRGKMLAEVSTPIADLQNQLYRIEIHQAGDEKTATFKWSRDNASAAVRIINMQVIGEAPSITIDPSASLEQLNFNDLQWVEIITEAQELRGESGILVQIKHVDSNVITLINWPAEQPSLSTTDNVVILRRWDMASNAIAIQTDNSISIENGLQVKFYPGSYRAGDYWLIAARAGTLIEWPVDAKGQSVSQSPRGINRSYAQLALCTQKNSQWQSIEDYRSLFNSLADIQNSAIRIEPDALAGSIDIKAQGNINIGAKQPATVDENGNITKVGNINSSGNITTSGNITCNGNLNVTNLMAETLIGMVAAFATPIPPPGWLECDGSPLDQNKYPVLFERLQTFFETQGNNNLPDLRGEFIRGWINTRNDPSLHDQIYDKDNNNKVRKFGGWELYTMQSHTHVDNGHTHPFQWRNNWTKDHPGNEPTTSTFDSSPTPDTSPVGKASLGDAVSITGGTQVITGSETRPRNLALMYCIYTGVID